MPKFKALTIYLYHDGPTLFTAQAVAGNDQFNVHLFRWTGDDDEEFRTYKPDDGAGWSIKENEVDWSEVQV